MTRRPAHWSDANLVYHNRQDGEDLNVREAMKL
jgi:hypothetical protein